LWNDYWRHWTAPMRTAEPLAMVSQRQRMAADYDGY
jgi:hypothetical protein